MIAWISWLRTVRCTPRSARVAPKRFSMPRILKIMLPSMRNLEGATHACSGARARLIKDRSVLHPTHVGRHSVLRYRGRREQKGRLNRGFPVHDPVTNLDSVGRHLVGILCGRFGEQA